jgi:hypothetical protein
MYPEPLVYEPGNRSICSSIPTFGTVSTRAHDPFVTCILGPFACNSMRTSAFQVGLQSLHAILCLGGCATVVALTAKLLRRDQLNDVGILAVNGPALGGSTAATLLLVVAIPAARVER